MYLNMLTNLIDLFGMDGAESWTFLSLLAIFAVAVFLFACIALSKKFRTGKMRRPLLVIYFLLIALFGTLSADIVTGFLEESSVSFLIRLNGIYKTQWIRIVHVATVGMFLLSWGILLFAKQTQKERAKHGNKAELEQQKRQSDINRFSSYFSQFDPSLDDDEFVLRDAKDAFREIGNNEDDVRAYIDRMLNKVDDTRISARNKKTIEEITTALEVNKTAKRTR